METTTYREKTATMADVDMRDESELQLPAVREKQQRQQQTFTAEQIALIKRTIMFEGASDDDLQLFLAQCKKTGLDPFLRQIYAAPKWDAAKKRAGLNTIVSIAGCRIIAHRPGQGYKGMEGPWWCADDGEWKDIWLDPQNPPAAAKVVLHKAGHKPREMKVLWLEFAQYKKDGELKETWREMPAHMLAIRAESLGLQALFPNDLSGVITDEPDTDAPVEQPAPAQYQQAKQAPPKPHGNGEKKWDWNDLATWQDREIPQEWLPLSLQGQRITFRQGATDPLVAFATVAGKTNTLRQFMAYAWPENKVHPRQRQAHEMLAAAYPSKPEEPEPPAQEQATEPEPPAREPGADDDKDDDPESFNQEAYAAEVNEPSASVFPKAAEPPDVPAKRSRKAAEKA